MELLLNGKWNFKEAGKDKVYEGAVPGDVMSDLMRNEVIPNPLIGLNEEKVQWVSDQYDAYFRK